MKKPMKPTAAVTLLNTYRAAVIERVRIEVMAEEMRAAQVIPWSKEPPILKRLAAARKKEFKLADKITGKLTSY